MEVTNATIRTVSDLTARWAAMASQGTVFSAAGVWPLPGEERMGPGQVSSAA